MNTNLILYHGSQQIVEVPKFGIGKSYNDYGQGFYCTESIELAKEWACQIQNDGYANKYVLHLNGLNVMHLTKGEFNILNWLAILLTHRKFDISSFIGRNAREYILSHFMPDTENVDVMIGYALFSNSGSQLKKMRKRVGLTQEELAAAADVSVNSIRAYERGSKDLSKAQFQTVLNLVAVLKCDVSDLLN